MHSQLGSDGGTLVRGRVAASYVVPKCVLKMQ